LKGPDCKNGVRCRGLRQQLQGKIGIKDPDTRWQLRLRIEKMSHEIFRGKIAKQDVGTYSGLRRIRKWALWTGRPPLGGGERVWSDSWICGSTGHTMSYSPQLWERE
jgi:hypothetical protein